MINNKKGFTLIELMACIFILGLVSLLSYPTISETVSSNNSKSCEYYERSMINAAKSYIQKESVDIIDSYGGTFPSSYTINLTTDLINNNYIDAYNDKKTTIENAKVIVTFKQSTKTYTYTPKLKCKSKNGSTLYQK